MADTIQRNMIADYLEVGEGDTKAYTLMGAGFNSLNENPTAQTVKKTYINDKSATTIIKGYETVFTFNSDLIKEEKAVMALYNVGRNQLTGSAAEFNYVRVELFNPETDGGTSYKARKFKVSAEVSNFEGAGGEPIKVTGNLNSVGDFVNGTFDVETKTFTEV